MSTIGTFDSTVKRYLSFLDNDYIRTGLSLFLLLYASLAAPQLPSYIAKLFDYTIFKLFIFFLIIYVSKHDPTIAIIAAIAVMVSMLTLSRYRFNQEMMTVLELEEELYQRYASSGINCKCTCSKNNQESEDHKREQEEEQEQEHLPDYYPKYAPEQGINDEYYPGYPSEHIRGCTPTNYNEVDFSSMGNLIKLDELRKLEDEILGKQMFEGGPHLPTSAHLSGLRSQNILLPENNTGYDIALDLDMRSTPKKIASGAPIDHSFDICNDIPSMITGGTSPIEYTHYIPIDIPGSDTDQKSNIMEERVARVLEEVNKYEQKAGKKITPTQLKNLCSSINDECCLSKPSLFDLQGSYRPKSTTKIH